MFFAATFLIFLIIVILRLQQHFSSILQAKYLSIHCVNDLFFRQVHQAAQPIHPSCVLIPLYAHRLPGLQLFFNDDLLLHSFHLATLFYLDKTANSILFCYS